MGKRTLEKGIELRDDGETRGTQKRCSPATTAVKLAMLTRCNSTILGAALGGCI